MSDVSMPHPRRWAILAVMCLALVVTGLDTLIVTMAAPSIRTQLHATLGQLQWVFDAYSLAFAVPILFAGSLADRFGRRRGFLVGMIIFLAGSVFAVLANSPSTLIAARAIMGLGAAVIMPSTLSLIRAVFPPEERARAMGAWVGVASLGVPLGPVIGGLLLDNFWWGSIFLINVPVIAVAIAGCLILIPESKNPDHPGLDYPGLLLSVVGSLLLVDGVIEVPTRGWSSALTLALIVGGAVILAGFIAWERRAPNPMLSHAVFSDRTFGGPMITIASVFFGVFGGLFLVTQYLQIDLRYRPLIAGVHMLPMCAVVLVAPQAPKLVQRFGLGPVSMLGPLLVAVSLLILALSGNPSGTLILIALAVMGLGIGFGAPPSVDSILGATPAKQSAAGSAVADVAMQFGGALGIALLGSLASTTTTASKPGTGWAAGAGVVAAGAVAAFAVLPPKPAEAARRSVSAEKQPLASN